MSTHGECTIDGHPCNCQGLEACAPTSITITTPLDEIARLEGIITRLEGIIIEQDAEITKLGDIISEVVGTVEDAVRHAQRRLRLVR